MHYNHFRYYDPELGRYITSDPIGLSGGMNTYGYVYQNPIRYTDPLGLISFPLPGGGDDQGNNSNQCKNKPPKKDKCKKPKKFWKKAKLIAYLLCKLYSKDVSDESSGGARRPTAPKGPKENPPFSEPLNPPKKPINPEDFINPK